MCTKDNFRCPYEMVRKNKKKKSHVEKREVVLRKRFCVHKREVVFKKTRLCALAV